jgi:hypothetical protein
MTRLAFRRVADGRYAVTHGTELLGHVFRADRRKWRARDAQDKPLHSAWSDHPEGALFDSRQLAGTALNHHAQGGWRQDQGLPGHRDPAGGG